MFAKKKKARKYYLPKEKIQILVSDQYTESLESENWRMKSLLSKLSIEMDLLQKKMELHQNNISIV